MTEKLLNNPNNTDNQLTSETTNSIPNNENVVVRKIGAVGINVDAVRAYMLSQDENLLEFMERYKRGTYRSLV